MAKRTGGYVYGICTNKDKDGEGNACPKCASKEVQQVRQGRDFVCSECGEPLMKTRAPKTFWEKYKIAVIGGAAVLLIVGGIVLWSKGGGESVPQDQGTDSTGVDTVVKTDSDSVKTGTDSLKIDTVKKEDPKQVEPEKTEPAKKPEPRTPKLPSNTLDLGYATYTGDIRNGRPHGNGTITYRRAHRIVETKDDVASRGDYVVGQFRDGKLLMGTWYQADGNQATVKR